MIQNSYCLYCVVNDIVYSPTVSTFTLFDNFLYIETILGNDLIVYAVCVKSLPGHNYGIPCTTAYCLLLLRTVYSILSTIPCLLPSVAFISKTLQFIFKYFCNRQCMLLPPCRSALQFLTALFFQFYVKQYAVKAMSGMW